jgi:serine/threonine protein kinase/tetratricopeptide (TPR) repeat protein
MAPDRRDTVKAVFSQALDLPESERAAFVRCSLDNTADRTEVETLLHWYSADYLASPALIELAPEPAGARFGPYLIVRELGHGGMGTVYLASRDDELAGRQVALKVVSAHGDPRDLEDRFTREKLALIKLEHPNIVSILDADTTPNGQAFLVMEYIDGVGVDAFCRERKLDTAERLQLFLQVCEAVAYAHRNLVIHRDLKPSNILVTREGNPKLVDFGVSKILGGDVEEALATTSQWRVTLRYASPEQIKGERLTTATDLYSLGVILYELLTGQSPYGSDQHPTRLIHALLHNDPVPPRQVRPALPADLEAIVLKSLRKDPAARYESADEFRDDIRSYLGGLPVKAWRGTSAYILRKFIRRHIVSLSGALAILLFLAVAAVSWYDQSRSNRNLDETLAMASDLSISLDGGFEPDGRAALIAHMHQVADLLIAQSHRQTLNRETRLALLDRLINIAEMLGHPAARVNLGEVAGASRILRESLRATEDLYAYYPDDAMAAHLASRNNRSLGSLLIEQNDYAAATPLFRRSLIIDTERVRRWPDDAQAVTEYADSLADLSRVYFHERNGGECLRLGRESVEFRRRAAAITPSNAAFHKDLGAGLSNYCGDLVEFGRYDETLGACQESDKVLLDVSSFPPTRRVALRLMANNAEHVGRAYAGLGRVARAIDSFQEGVRRLRRLQEDVPIDTAIRQHLARCLSRLAEAQAKAGQTRQARVAAAEAVQLAEQAAASDPSNIKEKIALEEIRERTRAALDSQK